MSDSVSGDSRPDSLELDRSHAEVEVIHSKSSYYYDGRPMTYFMYPALTWEELERFLIKNKASQACIDRAIIDIERYHLSKL